MKKIIKYIVLLIVIILVVRIYVYFLTKPFYRDMNNYTVLVQKPKIEITDSKIADNKGYIYGFITKNTGNIINKLTIKFDFFNSNNKYIGSEYKEIQLFNVGEENKFDIRNNYKDVEEIKISVVNE